MILDMEQSVLNGCLKNKEYFTKVFSYLRNEHFQNVGNATLFEEIKDYVQKFNSQPTIKEIGLKIKNNISIKDEIRKQSINSLKDISQDHNIDNINFFLKETEKWIQKIELSSAIFKSVDIIKGDLEFEPIIGLVSNALKISFDTDTGMKYNDSVDFRLDYYKRKLQGFNSGIAGLDKMLGSGFLSKTLNVFVAPSHGGKSIALLNLASTNILKGKNVLFLTLEMTEEEMGKRIDSNILDIDTNDFWSIPKEEFKKKFDAVKDSLGKLIIKEYPAGSFNTLKMESLISELQKEMDFTPDIICIDYLTLMASSRTTLAKAGNTYSYYKLIAEELHGFSKQFDVPIITAAQLGRGAFNNLEADMASIADSIGIIQTADTVIALLSSDNLKTNKQMVIKALKNRNTGRLDNLLVGTAFERMKFTEIEDSEQPQQPINESFQLGVPGLTQESNIDFGGFNFD